MRNFRKPFTHILLFSMMIMALCGCGSKDTAEEDAGLANLETIEGDFTAFAADTMSGKTFSTQDLADYDLTVINIWSTTCGYCIDEMEGLEKFYEQLPDNVNFVTICVDAAYDMDLAQSILDKKGATYETLIGNTSLNDAIMKNIAGTPTTVFVDNKGNIVGDSIVGAPCVEDMDRSAKLYMNATNTHLEELN